MASGGTNADEFKRGQEFGSADFEVSVDKLLSWWQTRSRRRANWTFAIVVGVSIVLAFIKLSLIFLVILLQLILTKKFVDGGVNSVFWIRRFNLRTQDDKPIARTLANACTGLGYLVTVRNETISTSRELGEVRVWITYLASGLLAVFAWQKYTESDRELSFLLGFRVNTGQPELFWSLVITCALAAVLIAWRTAFIRLGGATYMDRISDTFKQIHLNRGLFAGPIIFKCDDRIWRDVVEYTLSEADVVIADISDVSSYTLWEIETAARLVGPDRMIFLSTKSREGMREIPEDTWRALSSSCSGDLLGQAQILFYAGPRDRALEAKLRRAIARALVYRYNAFEQGSC
jgi:hypothetical protein